MVVEIWAMIGVWAVLAALLTVQGLWTPLAHGFAYGLGPRDEAKPRSVFAGRVDRTVANHIESMALFLPVVIAAIALDASTQLSAWGALTFLVGRIAFAFFYIGGVPVLRSAAFGVSLVGLAMMMSPVVDAILAQV
ncbi:MAG: MAPEG family protein [Maricaulaceae bacterium]